MYRKSDFFRNFVANLAYMKKILLLIVFCCVTLLHWGQVTSYSVTPKPQERIILPYDSLSNITRNNIPSLIGQQVQVLPKVSNSDLETGPTLYSSKPSEFGNNNIVVNPDTRFTVYRSRKGAFDNEVFDIIGVDSIKGGTSMYKTTYFYLVVQNEKYNTPHYLSVGFVNDEYSFGKLVNTGSLYVSDFIILGYFAKQREINIGNYLVNRYPKNRSLGGEYIVYNLEDGEPLKQIPENHIWTIKDIGVVEAPGYKGLSYILTSDSIPNAFARYYKGNFTDYREFTQRQEERRNWETAMIRKYGRTNGNLIIQGKVKLGFTKEMCREAWGSPSDINKSSGSWGGHEQWVYGLGSYLYFENGRLTAIDN